MGAKIHQTCPVLTRRSVTHAVMKDGFQLVSVPAPHVQLLIDHDSIDSLAGSFAHDPRLAEIDGEPFLQCDGSHQRDETPGRALELPASRKYKIVGITGVAGAQ